MYVKKIFVANEDRIDDLSEDRSLEIINPSWDDIEAALRQMNGSNKNLLILFPYVDKIEDGEFMSIGGGEDQKFVCCLYDDNGIDHCLTNPSETSKEIINVYMGQTTGQLKSQLNDIELVLMAMRTYVYQCQLDPSLYWRS